MAVGHIRLEAHHIMPVVNSQIHYRKVNRHAFSFSHTDAGVFPILQVLQHIPADIAVNSFLGHPVRQAAFPFPVAFFHRDDIALPIGDQTAEHLSLYRRVKRCGHKHIRIDNAPKRPCKLSVLINRDADSNTVQAAKPVRICNIGNDSLTFLQTFHYPGVLLPRFPGPDTLFQLFLTRIDIPLILPGLA